jgi:hypothetical protein
MSEDNDAVGSLIERVENRVTPILVLSIGYILIQDEALRELMGSMRCRFGRHGNALSQGGSGLKITKKQIQTPRHL